MGHTLPIPYQLVVNRSNTEVTHGQKVELGQKGQIFHDKFCRACSFEQFFLQILVVGRHGSHLAYLPGSSD